MVGASVLGVFLQGLPPDRRVAMARVASLIRRAARGVRESKRFGLVFYELNGGPLFALESRDKLLTLYVAERKAAEPFFTSIAGFDTKRCLINFADLNRLPLPDIEKLVRASVVARRERGSAPDQKDLLSLWGVKEEEAAVAPAATGAVHGRRGARCGGRPLRLRLAGAGGLCRPGAVDGQRLCRRAAGRPSGGGAGLGGGPVRQ